jgi:hypothetical protein
MSRPPVVPSRPRGSSRAVESSPFLRRGLLDSTTGDEWSRMKPNRSATFEPGGYHLVLTPPPRPRRGPVALPPARLTGDTQATCAQPGDPAGSSCDVVLTVHRGAGWASRISGGHRLPTAPPVRARARRFCIGGGGMGSEDVADRSAHRPHPALTHARPNQRNSREVSE